MSTSCWESAIIQQPIDRVWAVLRPMEFVWNPRVMSVRAADEKGVPNNTPLGVGEERFVHYRDTTKQRIRLLALSDARYSVSWTVVESTPAVAYSAVVHTVTLRRVTSTGGAQGAAAGAAAAAAGALPAAQQATFIEWNAEFSADATTAVTEDARFKIADAFAALREKSANIVFANELNARFAAEKVPIFATSLHPGVILETELGRHLTPGGPVPPYRLKTIAQGSATTIVAAMHPRYASEGGVYLDDCQPKAPNPYITAPGVGDKLWALTEKLIAAAPK